MTFLTALFLRTKWEQPKSSSNDGKLKCGISTQLTGKKSEVLIHTTTKMNLKHAPRGQSPSHRTTYYTAVYMKCPEQSREKKLLPGAENLRGKWKRVANRYGICFGDDKNVPELRVVVTVWFETILKTTLKLYSFQWGILPQKKKSWFQELDEPKGGREEWRGCESLCSVLNRAVKKNNSMYSDQIVN